MTARPAAPLRRISRRWLVWLALLLPFAQSAAAWHAFSHPLQQTSPEGEGKQALHPVHCQLCLSAADLGAGALPSLPSSAPIRHARHAVPAPVAASLWTAPATPAYLSRAPPFAPR